MFFSPNKCLKYQLNDPLIVAICLNEEVAVDDVLFVWEQANGPGTEAI